MPKDKARSAQAQNKVTIRHGVTDTHLWAYPEFSEGYDGPEVTLVTDESYTGGEIDVPVDQLDHIYVVVGRGPTFQAVPLGSETVVEVNCAGPGGG